MYLADSSVAAANAAGRKPSRNSFPPPTKENLIKYRNEANATNDPRLQLNYAKFLLTATARAFSRTQDPKRVKKARENMIMEAQKIVKKLASHSGMGKHGYAEAQFFLANCYGTGGLGLQKDTEKAFSLYLQGSKQNHAGCTYRAAVCYEVGAGTKRDKNHAMQFYRKAANLGEPTAMYKVGIILLKGFLGQPKNPREGISWLKRASQSADQDHPHALHELAMAYEKEGVPSVIPDPNYSRELYSQAAQYGYVPSQLKLGLAYENGFLNCPIDPRRSIAWYSKAAQQGDLESQFALSGWYLTGADGILQQNDTEAYLWARKAADRGYSKAEYAVGYYTETGTGVPRNIEEAKRWYRLAAAQNYRRAKQRLAELKHVNARPRQRRRLTREDKKKDSECNIM
jgi:TPR repeat protein